MTSVEACEAKTNTTPEFPMGWFSVARSHELAIGEVKPVQAFDRELVLYRTRSGVPALQDAFCPHLGAHLGHEGRVIGETIRCPFHGWQFNADDGKCSHIPYCDDIPDRARVRTWHTEEKNGEVYVWFHPENIAPLWELPELPELGDPSWTVPRYTEHLVPAHVQDICENSCDPVHFAYVHSQMEIPESEVTIDPDSGCALPLHVALMSHLGVTFTEIAQLDPLADDCAQDGQWSFLYVAAPLKVVNGSGAPVNPVVIK